MNAPRHAWKAVLLSLLAPGLGELYAGAPRRAVATFLLVHLALLLLILPFIPSLGAWSVLLMVLGGLASGTMNLLRARSSARAAGAEYVLRPYNRWWIYLAITLVMGLYWDAVMNGVRANVIQAFRAPSSSMEPSVLAGDFLLADKRAVTRRRLVRGDIIVFASRTQAGVSILKRVVGLGGDTLVMRRDTLYRNGVAVDEPYAQRSNDTGSVADPDMLWQRAHLPSGADTAGYRPNSKNWGPIVVPPGQLFVLGDHRDNSYDSRYWGFVPESAVQGKPMFIYLSFGEDGIRTQRIGVRLDGR